MTDQSKLTLSAEEQQLVTNAGWILTKRKIINKVNVLFGELAVVMKTRILAEEKILTTTIIQSTPKIAKGENYLQLPYVLLDYPRCFDKENIFAIRTMFWWGNFFSCTLHLSGSYKEMFEQAMLNNIAAIQKNSFYICINEDQWQHHFEPDNYLPTDQLTTEEVENIMIQQPFIKVTTKFSLHQWNEINVLLEKSFSDVLHLLKH
jgi:hypothetical protein